MEQKFEFDIMDSAGYGYYRVWQERAYLFKLVMVPFLIKLACTVTVLVLGYENNILRQGLILLPGDLAIGWVLAQYLRTLLKNERWPTVLPLDMNDAVLDALLLRARGIVACTLSYALIAMAGYVLRFCLFGQFAGDMSVAPEEGMANILSSSDAEKPADISPAFFIPLAVGGLALVWLFRLMWVYIPFAVLMPVKSYLHALGGFMASIRMMILFFCAMAPVMFVMVMVSRMVFNVLGDVDGDGANLPQFIVVLLAVSAEILVALITTGSFAWAMRGILPKNADALKDLPKLGE